MFGYTIIIKLVGIQYDYLVAHAEGDSDAMLIAFRSFPEII